MNSVNEKRKNQAMGNKIKVNHDFNEVSEGVEYIMTIKDKNVLEADEEDLDVLENEILNLNKNLKLSEKRTLEKEQDQYLKDQILSKYDDENSKIKGFIISHDNKKSKIKNSEINLELELDENNNPINDKNNFTKDELKSIKEKLKGLRNNSTIKDKNIVELNTEKKFSSDYMTPEEFKPKEFNRKKITNSKKIISLEHNENEGYIYLNEDNRKISCNKNKIINNNFYKNTDDEYNELSKFLEKQRNLVNKNKIVEAPEEKIKNLLLNNTHKSEVENYKDKDFNFIDKKEEIKEKHFNETITNKKNKQGK